MDEILKKATGQNKQVLQYMIDHGSISQAEAVSEFDIYRLSARIYDLRDLEVNIVTDREPNKTRRGTHARYRLEVE